MAIKYINANDLELKIRRWASKFARHQRNGGDVAGYAYLLYRLAESIRSMPAVNLDGPSRQEEEMPAKTYMDVLLERCPKAKIGDDGVPEACRKHLFKATCPSLRLPNPYKVDCQRCWNEPYKEDKPS